MPSTSIKLKFSNRKLDSAVVSEILQLPVFSPEGHSSDAQSDSGFPYWELPVKNSSVEEMLELWVSVLESVQAQLKALSHDDIGAYLDVRIYEDNFCLDNELLSRMGKTDIALCVWFNPPEKKLWEEPEHLSTLTFPCPAPFYCQLDEAHFFKWLQSIDGVLQVRGVLRDLTVYLCVPNLSDAALIDLISLLQRYDVPMSSLRTQLTSKNEHWLKDPDAYWYEKIFADPSSSNC